MDWKKTIEAYNEIMSSETFHSDKEFRQQVLLAFCHDVEMQTVHNYEENRKRRIPPSHLNRKPIEGSRKRWVSWETQRRGNSNS